MTISQSIRDYGSRASRSAGDAWLSAVFPELAFSAFSLEVRRCGGGVAAGDKRRNSAGRKTAPAPPDTDRSILMVRAFALP
jgi:hypothetical protein